MEATTPTALEIVAKTAATRAPSPADPMPLESHLPSQDQHYFADLLLIAYQLLALSPDTTQLPIQLRERVSGLFSSEINQFPLQLALAANYCPAL